MLHGLGYWRPQLTAFPEPPPSTNTLQMQELQRTDRARYDAIVAETRTRQAAYARAVAQYDDETIAAVAIFPKDRKIDYHRPPPRPPAPPPPPPPTPPSPPHPTPPP